MLDLKQMRRALMPRIIVAVVAISVVVALMNWWLTPRITRALASSIAENTGGDWVVVQLDMNGQAFRCWSLHDASIANEENSDGIFWVDSESGNLVHISGTYNRVQVTRNNWDRAYRELGLNQDLCQHIHDHQESSER